MLPDSVYAKSGDMLSPLTGSMTLQPTKVKHWYPPGAGSNNGIYTTVAALALGSCWKLKLGAGVSMVMPEGVDVH